MDYLHDIITILEEKLHFSDANWSYISDSLTPNQAILLRLLLENRSLSDTEASHAMYKMEPTLESFKHVRRELKHSLSQLILSYRPSRHLNSNIQVAYYHSVQLLAVMNTLRGIEKANLTITIAEQLLKKAKKYHFTDVVIETAQYLSRMYAANKKTQHKYQEVADLSLEANRIRSCELLAEQAYSKLKMNFNNRKENNIDAANAALASYQELSIYESQGIESYKFYISYFLLGIMSFEAIGDYEASLNKSLHAFQFFQSLPYDHRVAKGIFLNHLTGAQIQLLKLEQAAETSDQALQFFNPGTQNWAQAYYYLIKIKIMNQEYQEAYIRYQELSSSRAFKELPHDKQGAFTLMGAYLDFLVFIKVINSDVVPKRFSFHKFRQAYPGFDTDSRGMRITIIILEALYHIMNEEYEYFGRKVDSLNEYCARKLIRKSPYHRSSCFIRLLLLIPVNRYTKPAVKRKAPKYLKQMALNPQKIKVRESVAIEVINYEHLWEMVIELFQSPKRITKKLQDQIDYFKK